MSREVATAFLIRQGCVIVACVIVRNSVKHLCKNLSKIASETTVPSGRNFTKQVFYLCTSRPRHELCLSLNKNQTCIDGCVKQFFKAYDGKDIDSLD